MRSLLIILSITTCLRVSAQNAFEDYITTCRTTFSSPGYNETQTINDRDSTGKLIRQIGVTTYYNSAPEDSFQYFYTYDLNENLTGILHQVRNDTAWTNVGQTLRSFNSNGKVTHTLHQYWNETAWANEGQFIASYDANLSLISELSQQWINSSWVNNTLNTYTYDSLGRKSSFLRQDWDNTVWRNWGSETYSYDSLFPNIQITLSETWSNNQWLIESRDSITHDSEGRVLYQVRYVPDDSIWIKIQQIFQLFNDDTLLSRTVEDLNLGVFVATSYSTYTYDNGRLVSTHHEGGHDASDWRVTECSYQYLKYTHSAHAADELPLQVAVYPNPFREATTFSLPPTYLQRNGDIQIRVYGSHG